MADELALSRLVDRIEELSHEIDKANTFAEEKGYNNVDDELLAKTVKNGEALVVLANALSSQVKSHGRYSFSKKRESYKSVKKAFHYSTISMTFNANTYLARKTK
jgi:hypothetical protein